MCDRCPARRSTLPFDVADMIATRLLPAQFARVVGVSKQSVSKWIRAGKVTLGPDGRLDPVAGIQEVLKNTAPTRLRARLFRQAMEGADAMRVEIRGLQRKCAELAAELQASGPALQSAQSAAERAQASARADVARARTEEREHAERLLAMFSREVAREFAHLKTEHESLAGDLPYALGEIRRRVVAGITNARGDAIAAPDQE